MKIPLLVFMSEIKTDLTLKKIKNSVSFMLKIAIIWFIPMRQRSRQRHNFFSGRLTPNWMLPVCLLGMILLVT